MQSRETAETGNLPAQGEDPQWVKDFPIVVGQDNYVARRDFTKFLVLTSFAFVLGQLWIGFQSMVRRGRGKPPIRPIAQLSAIPIGSAFPFKYRDENDPCLLIRTGENELVAYSQKCTHLSCAVVPQIEKRQFYCPCHEGRFDLSTGRPLSGPPRRSLPRITLENRNGTIYATGIELSAT